MDLFKLFGIIIISISASMIYIENIPDDPKSQDKKIIKAYNEACLVEEQLRLAETKKKDCPNLFKELVNEEYIEQCNLYSYKYALINTYGDGSLYGSFIKKYLKNKQIGSLPLSNGQQYKGTCPKFEWINVDEDIEISKVLEK